MAFGQDPLDSNQRRLSLGGAGMGGHSMNDSAQDLYDVSLSDAGYSSVNTRLPDDEALGAGTALPSSPCEGIPPVRGQELRLFQVLSPGRSVPPTAPPATITIPGWALLQLRKEYLSSTESAFRHLHSFRVADLGKESIPRTSVEALGLARLPTTQAPIPVPQPKQAPSPFPAPEKALWR